MLVAILTGAIIGVVLGWIAVKKEKEFVDPLMVVLGVVVTTYGLTIAIAIGNDVSKCIGTRDLIQVLPDALVPAEWSDACTKTKGWIELFLAGLVCLIMIPVGKVLANRQVKRPR